MFISTTIVVYISYNEIFCFQITYIGIFTTPFTELADILIDNINLNFNKPFFIQLDFWTTNGYNVTICLLNYIYRRLRIAGKGKCYTK